MRGTWVQAQAEHSRTHAHGRVSGSTVDVYLDVLCALVAQQAALCNGSAAAANGSLTSAQWAVERQCKSVKVSSSVPVLGRCIASTPAPLRARAEATGIRFATAPDEILKAGGAWVLIRRQFGVL
ncbi:unnamed protein product [Clonostachys chloroleuca]|uniref:Uncharacterized protein n=1 Tax=Clonostachys chloroleuca TaxID=1926264 RepID=A0AA35LX32_9HYPO|nr:unnamed protein product [Clonostachys chloroleuca]